MKLRDLPHVACARGHFRIVCELLEHNELDENVRDSSGCAPLVVACRERQLLTGCELLKQENVDAKITMTTQSSRLPGGMAISIWFPIR